MPSARPTLRRLLLTGALAAAVALTACGGGGAYFEIGVAIGGQPVATPIEAGATSSLQMRAGQSIVLDASEPVQWTLHVGGTTITGSGITVSHAGVEVTVTALSASRIAIDTYAPFLLSAPVAITLVATSTFDAAEVAVVDILITN